MPDQFQVNCPLSCRCNKTVIECRNNRFHGTNFFLRMRPEAFPDLDTIIVTGNLLGDIAKSNLFGMNVTHKSVSLVNLSNDRILSFDHQTFQALPALEYFYLSNNDVQSVGIDPFRFIFF